MTLNNAVKRITVVGGGYVGLSLACMLAARSTVKILDVDPAKVEMINNHVPPIADRGISNWFSEKKSSTLSATLDPVEAYSGAEMVIIAVPTDFDWQTNEFDTTLVENTIRDALSFSMDGKAPLIVIRSTIPIGFTEKMRSETGCKRILFSPEFLREGHALEDSLSPSRVIIGADKDDPDLLRDADVLLETIQQCSTVRSYPVQIIDSSEAEAVKLFSNSYLALRIAYFNELDSFAESRGLNTRDIITGMGLDPRIGQYYNNPSFGYGGYCLPKDTRQLLSQYTDVPQNLITAIVESNSTRIDFIADRILDKALQLRKERDAADDFIVGIYRVNMKKDSDNCRQSSTMELLKRMAGKGCTIEIYEPLLDESMIEELSGCRMENDIHHFKKDCGVIIANRIDAYLEDVRDKVYTRDIFYMD